LRLALLDDSGAAEGSGKFLVESSSLHQTSPREDGLLVLPPGGVNTVHLYDCGAELATVH